MKHLTLNDRFELKQLLNEGYKKKEIAVILGCRTPKLLAARKFF